MIYNDTYITLTVTSCKISTFTFSNSFLRILLFAGLLLVVEGKTTFM